MDILNFIYLKRAELIKAQVNDPTTDLIVLGAEVPFTTRDDGYQVYAMTVDDFKTAVLPTLQEVLDFNHDLVSGNNFQGTGAGVGNTGANVIAVGTNSANNNTGTTVNAFGFSAASSNTGTRVNAIGQNAAQNNTGSNVNAFGVDAANNNTGDRVDALGRFAAGQNTGDRVAAIGSGAAAINTGNNVIALGADSANSNTGNNVIALGTNAGVANSLSGMFIIANTELPSYLDFTAASAAITPTGIAGNTYLYHDQTTNAIGAVRL